MILTVHLTIKEIYETEIILGKEIGNIYRSFLEVTIGIERPPHPVQPVARFLGLLLVR